MRRPPGDSIPKPALSRDNRIRRIDQFVVQVATAAATVFLVGVVVTSLASGMPSHLVRAVPPGAVSGVGITMIVLGRPHALIQLLVGMAGLVFIVAVDGTAVPGEPLFGLLSMAIVGTLLVKKRAWLFVAAIAPVIGYLGYAWQPEGSPTEDRIVDAASILITFLIAGSLLAWVQRQSVRYETRLERLVRSKDDFVAAVSHELRTPLTTIVGLSLELDDRLESFSPAERRELIGLIKLESQDVADIVEDLLVIGQDGDGDLQIEVRPVSIAREVADAVAARSGMKVHSMSDRELIALADAARTRQVIRNLVTNALRYGGPEARIVLRHERQHVVVEVRDTGSPIPVEEREMMFLPYQRGQAAAGTPGSVGLGLTVSLKLARLMGGNLTYRHDGREGVFSFTLPVQQSQGSSGGAASTANVA